MNFIIDELSVFFPVYNEEKNIENTVKKAIKVLEKIAKKWEIIIVEDGSKDNSLEVVKNISKKYKNIRLVIHEKNRGYGGAFKSGFYNAKYNWITFTDADGQFDFSEISNFINKQKETNADLVIGYYKKRRVPFVRIVNSKAWELVVYLMFGLHVRDIDCGFKLVNKKVIEKIPKLEAERGAFISSEFLIKAKRNGFKIVEIPITHYPRVYGRGTGADLKVIINSFIDLWKLRNKIKTYEKTHKK